jgi:PPOX class probable F420-dependent enzyme
VTAAEARERFESARVARLATADASGRPHLVPVAFVVATRSPLPVHDTGQGERVIYSAVDAKPKRTTELRRLANVWENPAVSLLADHYEEDWRALWWARADGVARVLGADEPEARRAHELLAERYPQQRGAGTVLAVDVERWSGWSAR